jgi:hypothetical protein
MQKWREIQKTVTEIIERQDSIELENKETELRNYMDIVIKEVK